MDWTPIYESSNGDRWDLVREQVTDRLFVKHTPNIASSGLSSHIELGEFLCRNPYCAEHLALLDLIGSLVQAQVPVDLEPRESGRGYVHTPLMDGGPFIAVVLREDGRPLVTTHASQADAEEALKASLGLFPKAP